MAVEGVFLEVAERPSGNVASAFKSSRPVIGKGNGNPINASARATSWPRSTSSSSIWVEIVSGSLTRDLGFPGFSGRGAAGAGAGAAPQGDQGEEGRQRRDSGPWRVRSDGR